MAYNQFRYDEKYYLPENWGAKGAPSFAEMKSEYSHLYKVARRRLKVFEKHGATSAHAYKYNSNLKPASKLSGYELAYALHDVYRMLTAEGGTYTGYKKQLKRKVERLQADGLTFVNNSNIESFNDFMQWWRESESESIYSSEVAAQLYGQSVKKKIDIDGVKENFDYFADNVRQLADMPRLKTQGKPASADRYRKQLAIERGRRTRQTRRLEVQARERGIELSDLDTKYWRENIRELEHMDVIPGATARDYKNKLSQQRRQATAARNKKRKRK